MGTEIKVENTKIIDEDDIPLAQRLKNLQAKRALESKKSIKLVNPAKVQKDKSKDTDKKVKIKKDPYVEGEKVKRDPIVEKVKIKKDPGEGLVVKVKPDPNLGPTSKKPKLDPGIKQEKAAKNEGEVNGKEDEEENLSEEEEYKWWEQENDGTIKWTTLEHNGPYFPPPYVPHNIPMLYDNKPVHLEAEAEEVATFFAGVIGTDHGENPVFIKNFFEDFCGVLKSINSKYKNLIKDFNKCNFGPIFDHLTKLKEIRKAMTKEEKNEAKLERKKIDDFYGMALLDGRKEKVGNFRIEPPGLFRGRGKHPRTGKLKLRVTPEQITINIGEGATVPTPPEGHTWGKIVHDNTVTWLYTWAENVNKQQKYVYLAPGSSIKGQSDLKKFETARKLKNCVDHIRKVNFEELRSKEMFIRQRATALWLIDKLALRAGNEKGEDEADTVGCCSLRVEHVRLQEPNIVIFDFLGKDSIRYYNEVPVDGIIFKNLGIFMRSPKAKQDPIFDRLTTSTLNKYLSGLMPGLTAKVFRTFNASHTFQQELDKTSLEGTVHDQVLAYNRANRQVAILCNHQRSVPKTHQQSMENLAEKILTMKYQRYLTRKQLSESVPKSELKSECPQALEEESDLDEDTITRKAKEMTELELEKAKQKSDSQDSSASPRKSKTSKESLIKKFNSLNSRIEGAKNQKIARDENKTTALSTSKNSYIDPRITYAWCQKHQVPVEKFFSKTLRSKFNWASFVDKDWAF